jgi:hypothetical protein
MLYKCLSITSEFVGSILATDSCEESVNALLKVLGFLRFPPPGKVDRVGYRISIVRKVISQLLL